MRKKAESHEDFLTSELESGFENNITSITPYHIIALALMLRMFMVR